MQTAHRLHQRTEAIRGRIGQLAYRCAAAEREAAARTAADRDRWERRISALQRRATDRRPIGPAMDDDEDYSNTNFLR